MSCECLPALFYLESKHRLAYHLLCPPLGSLGFTYQGSIILTETSDSKRALYFSRVPISDLGVQHLFLKGGAISLSDLPEQLGT